jgi:hypothetical protein
MIEPRDEELSRIYGDADGPRPAQRVDDNIIAASQRVAGAKPQPAGVRFARRWGTPFALAATVVVTFTLTLIAFERESGLDTVAPKAPRAGRPAKVSPAEPKRADHPGTPPAVLQPIAPARPVPRDLVEQRPGESAVSSGGLGTKQPAFIPEVPRTSEVLRRREEAKPAPAAPAPGASGYSTELPGAGQPAPLQEVPRAEARQQIRAIQAPAPAAGAVAESAPTPQSAEAAGGLSRSAAAADAKERTPEKWLEDIRKLKTEGRAIEAERELAEFKKRYPDYRLPEDLR